ncbi:MAG TPA: GTP-binding protein [Aquificales bacterium]|nr:GTP-binding protein [Aquificales bacterium]
MNNKEKTTKLLIAGHFGAGKTTFVKTASQIKTVETERKTTLEEEKSKKQSTTVAMDYGEYQTEDGKKVNIFGVPGQKRFSFMWSILAKNTETVILLLDSTDTSRWYETFEQINVFRKEIPNAKFVFVANKRDLPNALSMEEIKKKLKLPAHMKLLECVATDKDSVISVIKEALDETKCETTNQMALANT